MPATARQIPISDKDLEGSGGGAYAELEVPGDYEAVLKDVEDYDFTKKGKSRGWIFIYEVETPSGQTVEFKSFASFGINARWKLVEILNAHEAELTGGEEATLNNVDPNAFVGEIIGVHIDFPRDKETDEPTSKYREIKEHFSLTEAPEEEDVLPEVADVDGDGVATEEEAEALAEVEAAVPDDII